MAIPSGVSAGTFAASAGATSITPGLPPSRVTNNIMFAYVHVAGAGKTISVGGGWTIGDSDSTNDSCAWAWRIIDGTEAAPVFSWTGSAACSAIVHQFTGNITVSPIGATNKATAAASTALTVAGLTTTADNSLVIVLMVAGNSQSIPKPSSWTNHTDNASVDGSLHIISGQVFKSGTVTEAIAQTITSANWNTFAFEVFGTGSAGANEPAIRATQAIQQTLNDGVLTNVRVTSVIQQTLYNYGASGSRVLVTQVVQQTLRSVSDASHSSGDDGSICTLLHE